MGKRNCLDNNTVVNTIFICAGNTTDQVKNGTTTPFLQIREGLGTNRALKPKPKKKRKGDTRQSQTGMKRFFCTFPVEQSNTGCVCKHKTEICLETMKLVRCCKCAHSKLKAQCLEVSTDDVSL